MDSQLPYPRGTPEAKAWLEGWAQGLHVKGHPPSGPEETNFDGSELKETASDERRPSRWKQFLKALLGR